MITWLARLLLFRILPRRHPADPDGHRARSGSSWGFRPRRYRVNEPWRSRTAPPPAARPNRAAAPPLIPRGETSRAAPSSPPAPGTPC